MTGSTVTQGTDTSFNLLTCDDDPNYDLATDGTNVAECEPGSKIVAVQLHMSLYNMPDGEVYEWVMGRDPDGAITAGTFTMATLYTQDVSGADLLLRKNAWAAGHIMSSTSHAFSQEMVRIKGSNLRRAGNMEDGDVIRLTFTASASATSPLLYLRGRIITRGP